MKQLFCIVAVVVVLWGQQSPAADAPVFAAHVKLIVKGDPSIQRTLEKHLRAALTTIADVVVTEDNPRYVMEVFVSEMGASTSYFGQKDSLGLALSVLVTQRSDPEALKQRLTAQVEAAVAEWVAAHVRSYVFVRGHWLEVATERQLENISRTIVATFNKKILNLDRPPVRTGTEPAAQKRSE